MVTPRPAPSIPSFLLYGTVFATGAIVLIVEILGTRLISPFFGNTIYVWSSLITVSLLALSIGYLLGGWWADHSTNPVSIYVAIGIAGVWLSFVPALRVPVMTQFSSLGLAWGAFFSSFVLFSITLVLLGTVGPQCIRLATLDIAHLGRKTGWIFALSTLGSVLGAVGTGFWLVPFFGVKGITWAISAALLLLSAIGLLTLKKKIAALCLVAGLIPLYLSDAGAKPSTNIIHRESSYYGDLKVVDFNSHRFLLIDGVQNTVVHTETGKSIVPYAQFLEVLPRLNPSGKTALLIGLGGGALLNRLPELTWDAVEIDAAILAIAKKYFGVTSKGELAVGDGRAYVRKSNNVYDFVVLDAFVSDQQPVHLMTQEFFGELKSRMSLGGIIAINSAHLETGSGMLSWECLYKTLSTQFSHVRAPFLPAPSHDGPRVGNALFFASDKPIDLESLVQKAPEDLKTVLERGLRWELTANPERLEKAVILTDDFNPIEPLLASAMSIVRQDLIKRQSDVLLSE